MTSVFLDLAPTVLLSMAGTSVIGALSYALCRSLQVDSKNPYVSKGIALGLIGLTCVPLYMNADDSLRHFSAVVIFLACCSLGAWAHRKTDSPKKTWWESLGLILAATMVSNLVGGVLLVFSPLPSHTPMSSGQEAFLTSFLIGLTIYPSLSPVGLLIWQNLRMEPGVDGALEESNPGQAKL